MMKMSKKTSNKEFECKCETCGAEMINKGESANPQYLVIECPDCGESFLLSKAVLRSKIDWEKLFSSNL